MPLNLFNTSGPIPGLINNEPFITRSTFTVLNPNDDERKPLHDAYGVDPEEAIKAVEAAHAALPAWRETSFKTRREIFFKVADLIKHRRAEIVALLARETTSTVVMSEFDLSLNLDVLEELGSVISIALKSEIAAPEEPGRVSYITREPYGVVFSMTPWNAPFVLATRAAATPIIGGNTVVLKTSEMSPLSNSIIAQLFVEAGLPPGVLNVIHCSPENAPKVTEAVIAHPAVHKVNFTGSTRVGSIIGALCGKYIKPVTLELGGVATLIVLEDADLEHAVKSTLLGKFFHSGQICMSTNNILVHESVADEYISILHRETFQLQASHSSNTDKHIRGLFNPASAKRVNELVADALSKGAEVVVGDANTAGKHASGNIVQPVILDKVTADMDISRTEIFGPALGITRIKTDAEAIALVNNTGYGLSGAIHSRDISRALRIARNLEVSLIHINSFTIHDHATLPHGGMKNSGFGRFNGFEGIREFTQIKVITVNDIGPIPRLRL